MEELRRGRWLLAALLASTWGVGAAAPNPPPKQAEIEALFAADRDDEAHARLAAWRPQLSGELWFDALLGRAAAKSGRYEEAIGILAALIAVHPGHDPSRFYLALALARTGRRDEASAQYAYLAENAATPAARAQAQDAINVLAGGEHEPPTVKLHPGVLAAMQERLLREKDWSAKAFLAAGHDSNANAAPSEDRFQRQRLAEEDLGSRTPFFSLGGDVHHRTINSDPFVWRNTLSGGARFNTSEHGLDTQVASVQTELRWKGEDRAAASALYYSRTWLDGDPLDSVAGWLNRFELLAEHALVSAGVQYAVVRYGAPFEARDIDSWVFEVRSATRPDSEGRWRYALTPLGGIEEARDPNSPFGRILYGITGSVGWEWNENVDLYASAGTLISHYEDVARAPSRDDNRYHATGGLTWQPAGSEVWSVSGGLSYTRNESSLALFDYDRTLASVELTRSWGGEE